MAKKKKKSTKSNSTKNKANQPKKAPATQPPPKAKPKPKVMAPADQVVKLRTGEKRRLWIRRGLIGVAVLAAIALVGWAIIKMKEIADLPNPQAKPAKNYKSPNGATKDGLVIGDTAAPVIVELYLDYNCTHCKEFEDQIGEDLEKQVDAKQIKLIFHPIARLTPYSVLASAASGCAHDAGKFIEYNKAVFENQKEKLDEDNLVKIGKRVGINSKKFSDCVDGRDYENWTLGLNQEANERQVAGTPTVFVGEKELIPSTKMKDFVSEVKKEIAEQLKASGQQ